MATFKEIQQQITNNHLAPIYFLNGDEPYYIDELIKQFENILPDTEKDFNLITLYGKDTTWQEVINAARQFPMFSEKMIVILREAAQLKDMAKLEAYFKQPSPNTLLVIDYRNKDLDKRTSFSKIVSQHSTVFTSKKIKEDDLPQWIMQYGKDNGFVIADQEATTLSMYLGNDLQKIINELAKVKINEPQLKQLSPQLIEQYIGISKEYNMFDLPAATFSNDVKKLSRMLNYFVANPKAAPLTVVIGSYFSFVHRIFLCHYSQDNFNTNRQLGIFPIHRQYARSLSLSYVHKLMSIVEEYSHKSVGISSLSSDTELLKEMIGKMKVLVNGQK